MTELKLKKSRILIFLLIISHFSIAQLQPFSRWQAHSLYNEINNKIILFGGVRGDSVLNDTWSFDGDAISNDNGTTEVFSDKEWERKYLPGPTSKFASTICYASQWNQTLLFGGSDKKEYFNDIGEWDGKNWIEIFGTNLKKPSGRSQQAACFDSKKGEMLVFGGSKHYQNTQAATEKADNTLWAWNGKKWKVLSETGPVWREDAKMVYHEKNQKTYLLGGRKYDDNRKVHVLNEFWEWDGDKWRLISDSTPMGKRLHSNMVYDTKRNRIVLFGGVDIEKGFSNDIWEWDGDEWRKINAATAPLPRLAHSMTFSKSLNQTVIAGGVSEKDEKLTDLWTWDGQRFEKINNEMPAVEPGSGNIISTGKGILLFGRPLKIKKMDLTGSSWLFDGKKWNKILSKTGPSLRENQSMVYDLIKKRVLLFGGNGREETNFASPDDLWEWQDRRWRKIAF